VLIGFSLGLVLSIERSAIRRERELGIAAEEDGTATDVDVAPGIEAAPRGAHATA